MSLVDDWKKLWKSWSVLAATLGAVLPSLLQVIADNTSLMPWLDDGYKSGIRLACLVLVIVLRPIRQKALSGDNSPTQSEESK